MDDPDGTYAPESPDLSAYQIAPPPPINEMTYLPPQHTPFYQPPTAPGPADYMTTQYTYDQYGTYVQAPSHITQVELDQQLHASSLHDHSLAQVEGSTQPKMPRRGAKQQPAPPPRRQHNRPELDMEIKTKFPVARIKRIMQADEDVGKVAQVTPVAVGKYSSQVKIASASLSSHQHTDCQRHCSQSARAVHDHPHHCRVGGGKGRLIQTNHVGTFEANRGKGSAI